MVEKEVLLFHHLPTSCSGGQFIRGRLQESSQQ